MRPPECAWHIARDAKLDYIAWHVRAEVSLKAGDAQTRCAGCARYFFAWERTPARAVRRAKPDATGARLTPDAKGAQAPLNNAVKGSEGS